MHELSLSMPEPMLSLSMLILATYPVAALEGTSPDFNMLTLADVVSFWLSFINFRPVLGPTPDQV